MTHGATKSLQQLMTKHQCGEHHAAVSPQLLGLPLTRSLETNHGAWWSDLVRRHELPAPCVRLRPCLDKDGRGLRGRQNHPLKHTGCRKAKKEEGREGGREEEREQFTLTGLARL